MCAQDDGEGHQEIVPSLLTQDTLNPSFYGMRIIARELAAVIEDVLDSQDAASGAGLRGLWRGTKPKEGRKGRGKGAASRPRRSLGGGADAKRARRQKAGRRKELREKRLKAAADGSDDAA